jgi:aldehyde:ferredoxin oxidoreductase
MTGLLTGTFVPTADRASFCSKLPLTGIWNEGTVGGYWPTELKKTGIDGIYITGRAEHPIYIWINDGKIEIRSAEHIWNKDTFSTDKILRNETHKKARVASIGLAGENLSPISNIMIDGSHPRTAGRGGLGAVMGSKNLKAIVVFGTNKIKYFDRNALNNSVKTINPKIKEKSKSMHEYGTAVLIKPSELSGDLPIKNFTEGNWREGAEKTCGEAMKDLVKGHHACYACPIGCSKYIELDYPEYKNIEINQPEYETAGGFGANCLNDDIESIIIANHLCNYYGMDTISTSVTIAFAMEAYEKGILTLSDTDNIDLSWGNKFAILTLIHKMAKCEGIGAILTRGTHYASNKFGKSSVEFAIHAKGLELPMHDPRCYYSMALNYATASRGGCHLESLSYGIEGGGTLPDIGIDQRFVASNANPEYDYAEMTIKMQNLMQIFNALGLCKFTYRNEVGTKIMSNWIKNVTGWDIANDELLSIGERLFNIKRLYNNHLGITRKNDTLPPRMLTYPRPSGKAKGKLPNLGKMLYEYYRLRDWTEEGIVKKSKLLKLDVV